MCEPLPEFSFEDLIQSDLFTFHIGSEKKRFVVHSKAVAATSEYFNTLVNGDMVEAQTRSAELQDVKPDDFVRFMEYAYRRDYTVPLCTEDKGALGEETPPSAPIPSTPVESSALELEDLPPPPPPPPPLEPAPEWNVTRRKNNKKEERQKPTLRSRFENRDYLFEGNPSADMFENFKPRLNSSPQQDYTPVFLTHARMYTFADMRLVQPLRALALHKLHKTLIGFKLCNRRVSDVLELARYAYDHGSERTSEGSINDLRKLVVEYIACELDTIGKHKEFTQLIEEGGEFVGDFWEFVQKNLL